LNKTDLRPVDNLNPEERALLNALTEHPNTEIVTMSNMTEEGVSHVKELACEKLLKMRAESKLQGKKINEITNRIHVSMPQPRDNVVSTLYFGFFLDVEFFSAFTWTSAASKFFVVPLL